MKKILLSLVAVFFSVLGAKADVVPTFSAIESGQDYYLYNVEYKGFLVGANDWGTRASVSREKGLKVSITAVGDTYKLGAMSPDNADGVWIDGSRAGNDQFTLTAGSGNTYNIGCTKFPNTILTWTGDENNTRLNFTAETANGTWGAVTQSDYDAYWQAVNDEKIANGDYSGLMSNDKAKWAGASGTYGAGVEKYVESGVAAGEILSQTITGLPAGTYSVKFNAIANVARNLDVAVFAGEGIAQAFANGVYQDITVGTKDALAADDWTAGERTIECYVLNDGVLKYGMSNLKLGGQWYVAKAISLVRTGDLPAGIQVSDDAISEVTSEIHTSPFATADRAAVDAALTKVQGSHSPEDLLAYKEAVEAYNTALAAAVAAKRVVLTPGEYLLKNVEAGKYLAAGNNWGTQASLLNRGDFFTLEAAADGKYNIKSQVSNGGNNQYLNGTFCDGAATGFAFYEVEGGYVISSDDATFLTGNNGIVDLSASAVSSATTWTLGTIDELLAGLAEATEESPVDATFLIKDANFGRNNLGYSNWKWEFTGEGTNHNKSGDNTNFCAESYRQGFKCSQVLENIPNGLYNVTAQGFYRQDGEDNENLPVFFANEVKVAVPVKTGEENSMTDASHSFSNGLYKSDVLSVLVMDGKLEIGIDNSANAKLWVIFDNFELSYLRPLTAEEEEIATGIANVANAANNSNVIFNLAGQRVANAKGIVIMNGKKVMVK